MLHPVSLSSSDAERTIEFEFVRATENAALNSLAWLGRGEKELADAAACDAIYGVFDLVDICGEVVIGEGIKDNAPGIFLGEHLGTWKPGAPSFDIALDPIDGTSNIANGLPNSISVMAASQTHAGQSRSLKHLPAFYSRKLAYGPDVVRAMQTGMEPLNMDAPLEHTLGLVAKALGKRVPELVVMTMNRPRHAEIISTVRRAGAALRLISDGDITAAVSPSLPESGVDLYYGIGGSPEGILTAAALKALGGGMLLQMWPRDEAEREAVSAEVGQAEVERVHGVDDLVAGDSSVFCATGISDSPLLPGVKVTGKKAITTSILMRARSRTVRYIRAVHDLEHKTIHLRSTHADRKL
ncbi:MAG: class fructose-bisphosphatase [Verrucomicrobiota bacterium]|jgi:fructose-1,6-bisphosphatase II